MRFSQIFFLALSLVLIAGCERRWASVPTTPSAIAACPAGVDEDLTVCGWARTFDDLVIFEIDAVDEVVAPMFEGNRELSADVAAGCVRLSPAIVLSGKTEVAARGADPRRIIIPGDHEEEIVPGQLAVGTRVLVPIRLAPNGEAVRAGSWPVVNDGVIVAMQESECRTDNLVVGLAAGTAVAEVAKCASAGDAVRDARLIYGAVCYADHSRECSIDTDCVAPGASCFEGLCRSE